MKKSDVQALAQMQGKIEAVLAYIKADQYAKVDVVYAILTGEKLIKEEK